MSTGNLDPRNIIFEEPEDKDFVVFAKGVYKFTIDEVNEMTLSRERQTPMLPMKLRFERMDGATTTVYENILFSEAAKWKLLQFLKCIGGDKMVAGKRLDFDSPDFRAWLKRQSGTARLKVSPVKGKDYDRNEVDAFIFSVNADERPASRPQPARKPDPEPEEDADDDIPF